MPAEESLAGRGIWTPNCQRLRVESSGECQDRIKDGSLVGHRVLVPVGLGWRLLEAGRIPASERSDKPNTTRTRVSKGYTGRSYAFFRCQWSLKSSGTTKRAIRRVSGAVVRTRPMSVKSDRQLLSAWQLRKAFGNTPSAHGVWYCLRSTCSLM